MIEILFRGMRKDNGEWVYGYYVPHNNKSYIYYEEIDEMCQTGSWLNGIEVIPETVGQDTGLCDKNGNRIFDGDVVAGLIFWQNEKKNGIVDFRDGSFGLIWYRGDIEMFYPFTSMCNIEYEVIRNIHDNPELLGEVSDA